MLSKVVTCKTKQPQQDWRLLETTQVNQSICFILCYILVFRDDEVGTVFRPDLYIEDFYFRESAKPHHGLTKLVAGFSAPGTLISATNRSVEHFYARAAKNLKRALPDLQILVLRGGYRYFPLKAVSFKDGLIRVYNCLYGFFKMQLATLISLKIFSRLKLLEMNFDACVKQWTLWLPSSRPTT